MTNKTSIKTQRSPEFKPVVIIENCIDNKTRCKLKFAQTIQSMWYLLYSARRARESMFYATINSTQTNQYDHQSYDF